MQDIVPLGFEPRSEGPEPPMLGHYTTGLQIATGRFIYCRKLFNVMVMVRKSTGEMEPLDIEKTKRSCLKAGAPESMADEVASVVVSLVKEGDTTTRIKQLIYEELHKREDVIAHRYDLKYAISRMDPVTFQFEKYVSRLFSYFGYNTERSPKPKPNGFCTDHEIDVFMKNSEGIIFIECKHHYQYYRYTGLDVPMRVWARLLDLRDGYSHGVKNSFNFKEAWVVTNTKFSDHAIKYAACKKIPLIGWNHPKGRGINYYIEKVKAYPLTIVPLTDEERKNLAEHDIINVKDFVSADFKALSLAKISKERSKEICDFIFRLVE